MVGGVYGIEATIPTNVLRKHFVYRGKHFLSFFVVHVVVFCRDRGGLVDWGAMRIFNHCHYAISLEIDCFYALLTQQICRIAPPIKGAPRCLF